MTHGSRKYKRPNVEFIISATMSVIKLTGLQLMLNKYLQDIYLDSVACPWHRFTQFISWYHMKMCLWTKLFRNTKTQVQQGNSMLLFFNCYKVLDFLAWSASNVSKRIVVVRLFRSGLWNKGEAEPELLENYWAVIVSEYVRFHMTLEYVFK